MTLVVGFENTGSARLNGVVILVPHFDGAEFVDGSAGVVLPGFPDGYVGSGWVGVDGVNVEVGDFEPGFNGWLYVDLIIDEDAAGCSLQPIAFATPAGYGSVRSDAEVKLLSGEDCEARHGD